MNTENSPPLFLFGAGGAASWVLAGFRRAKITVAGFLDESDHRPTQVSGSPVYSPQDAPVDLDRRRDAVVVLAIMNPMADFEAIKNRLSRDGWSHVTSLAEYSRDELSRSGRHCGMLVPGLIPAAELKSVRAILSDDHSRSLLDAFASFVESFDESALPPITSHPYFPPGLPRWSTPMRIIDCGAFDGDSLRAADAAGYTVVASASFEPDPGNYSRLAAAVKDRIGAAAWPCGVSDRTGLQRFSAQGDTGSSLQETGDASIQCVSLDDSLPGFIPTLIKMDIEGAEEDALKGAEGLIRRHSPGLAISVYHHSSDIWRIPLWLRDRYPPDTRYFLRRHSRTIADTVFYVLPSNQPAE